jgi:hypothetical protein
LVFGQPNFTKRNRINGSEGNWTVHCTYHLDPQTGKIDRMHFNIPYYEIWNTLSGVRYELIDTGNDNIGWWRGFWNDVTGAGLSLPADGELPDEGKAVGTFKVISKGGDVYSYSILYQLHRDASGNITVEKFKEIWDCN